MIMSRHDMAWLPSLVYKDTNTSSIMQAATAIEDNEDSYEGYLYHLYHEQLCCRGDSESNYTVKGLPESNYIVEEIKSATIL